MFKYAICEIKGKQLKIVQGKTVEVDFLGDKKSIEANILLKVEDNKIDIGKPYLSKKMKFENVGVVAKKIRVSRFHAKANYRKVTGAKVLTSRLMPVLT